jgi:NDP-sugar pyrophosphorylase family protein
MEIDKAVILMGGKATRLKDDPFLKVIPTKSFFPLSRIPEEETIFWRIIKALNELGIKEVYIVTTIGAVDKVTEYIKQKQEKENINIKIEVIPQEDMENGNRLLKLKGIIQNVFLVCYGDEVFDGKVKEEFTAFIQKSKEIIEKDKKTALIRPLVSLENYKGGLDTLEKQTKCKLEGDQVVWATKNEFLPRDKEILLFTSFMIATEEIFKMLKKFQKETGKEQVSLHDLEFTKFLIKEKVIKGVKINLNYFNINTKEDKQKLYEYFTKEDFKKIEDQEKKKDYKPITFKNN